MEIWKDIPGYEGFYQASTCGRIKSLKREVRFGLKYQTSYIKPEKIMSPAPSQKGYYYAIFTVNGKVKHNSVHRLIALTFIPNPENKIEVNHKNGNKSDNNIGNLEWNTPSENYRHSCDVLKRKPFVSDVKKEVVHISLDGFVQNVFQSRTEAAKFLGIGIPAITNAIKRKSICVGNCYLR